jgi:YD repeat-containing protein
MVAVVSGTGLGLFGSSVSALGGAGAFGNAAPGRGGDRLFVNTSTGNLIVQSQDEVLSALGLDLALVRTYNSQGLLDDDNGDNWRLGVHQRVYGLTGTVNTAGSTITKVFGDGREVVYSYNASQSRYVSTEGSAAHDTLSYNTGTSQWTWTDGSARNTETYNSSGQLIQARDADGNLVTYTYTGALLTQIADASGQTTFLDYTGNNLQKMRVVSNGQTQTLTSYTYDGSNRLIQVTVDLSPQDNSITDNQVYTTTYAYEDTSRRILSITQKDGSQVSFTYTQIDGAYRVRTYTDALGRVTTLTYSQATGGGSTVNAPANTGVLSTTDTQTTTNTYNVNSGALSTTDTQTTTNSYNLNTGALTAGGGGGAWAAAALLDTGSVTPQLGFDSNGNAVAVWKANSTPTATIYWSRYNKASNTWSAKASLGTAHSSYSPAFAVSATGDAVLAWAQGTGGIVASRFDATAGTWSAATVVAPWALLTGNSNQLSVSVNGSYAAVSWLENEGAGNVNDNFRMISRWNGSSWESAVPGPFAGTGYAVTTSVSVDSQGNVAVAWKQANNAAYVSVFTASTASWGPATACGGMTLSGTHPAPTVLLAQNGNGVVSWSRGSTMMVRTYSRATNTWSAAQEIDNRSTSVLGATVALDAASGDAIAAWVQNDGTALSVFSSRYTASSATWSAVQGLETASTTVGENITAQIRNGKAVVAWVQSINLYAARFSSGTWSAATLIENSADAINTPVAAIDAQGNTTVLWSEPSSGIQQARYATGGQPYYLVPSGATWQSVANTLYGVNSAAAGTALQTALGNPALTAGAQLTNLPATLSVTTTTTITVPPYYTIPSGATWQSVANTLYGVNSAAAGSALQTALGNPPLTAGNRLTNLPATLSVTTTTTITVPAYYTVQAGNTWSSITQTIYGTSTANAVAALQAATGNPTLTTGLHLTVPLTLTYSSGTGGTTLYQHTDVRNEGLGLVAAYEHDAAGRLRRSLSPTIGGSPLEVSYTYDADGNLATITEDPAGLNRVTTYAYDGNGNLLNSRDSLGNTVTRTYNANNQLLTETQYLVPDPDAGGSGQPSSPLTARYVYDSENHLLFVISAEGRVSEHRYAAFTATNNRDGLRVTTFVYAGAVYSLTGLTPTDTLSESQLTTWVGSQNKTLLERTDYAYDFRGNLSTLTRYSTTDSAGVGSGTPSITKFVYDQRGQLLQTLEARGSGGTPDPVTPNPNLAYATTYVYDGLGRVLSATQWNSGTSLSTTLTSYDDANRLTTTTIPANGLVTTRTYNRAGELITVQNGTSSQVASLGTTTYAYDAGSRLRIVTDPTVPTGVRQFTLYDDAGRRSAVVDGDGTLTEFIYDRASKLIKTVQYAARIDSTTLASLADGSGNPTAVTLATLRTAASGNAAQDRITRNVWDNAGRLVYTIDEIGALTQFFYDGAGRITDQLRYTTPVTISRTVDQVLPGSFTVTTHADDRRSRNFYDAEGRLLGTLDGERYLTEYRYDAAGRLVEQIGYANQVTSASWQTDPLNTLRPAFDEETGTDPERDSHHYCFYDGQGRKIGALDAEGYLTETVYDVAGNVSQTVRYDRVLTYTAGTSTFQTLKTAAAGAVTHTTADLYDGAGRLKEETNFEGTITRYDYDDLGRLIGTTRAATTTEARTTQTRYDLLGRVLQELTAEGSAAIAALTNPTQTQINDICTRYGVTYEYDLAGRRTTASVRPNDTQTNTTLYFYDNDNRLRFEVNALGERKEYQYNALGQLTDSIEYFNRISTAGLTPGLLTPALITTLTANASAAQDGRTVYQYSLTGRVSSLRVLNTTTAADDSLTTYSYNAFGEQDASVESIDATRTLRHEYRYDKRGLLTLTRWDPSGFNTSESRTYDAFGRLTQVVDARSNTSKIEYDRLGRQIATVDALAGRRTTVYDGFSRTLTLRDALNNATTYSYNDTARSTTITTQENIVITTTATRHGQTLSVTAAGNTTSYGYDRDGNLTSVSDNLGTLESRTYDRRSRQETGMDARGIVTRLSYDAANRVLTSTQDSGTGGLALVTTYTYDGRARVATVQEPSGRVTQTTYDRSGRITQLAVDPSGLNLRTRYDYDRAGHVVTLTEGFGSTNPRRTQYIYDTLGRRTEEIVDPTSLGGTLNLRTQYRYDANGNVTRKIDARGNSTWYVYDAGNRLRFTIGTLGAVVETLYDAEDRVRSTREYATALSAATLTTLATRDTPTTSDFSVTTAAGDRFSQSIYDRDGRERFSVDAVGAVTERTFDGAGRVTRTRVYTNPIAAATYTTETSVTGALTAAGNSTSTIAATDRVKWTTYDVRGRAAYQTDAAGAVIKSIYDASGNITSIVAYATLRATTAATDLASLDIWAATAAIANHADNRTTRYWYDGADRQVFELDGEGYLTETRYDDAARRSSTILYASKPTIAGGATTAQVRTNSVVTGFNATRDRVSTSERDIAGRTVRVFDALTTAAASAYEEYGYDAVGNQTSTVDPRGAELAEKNTAWAQAERVRRGYASDQAALTAAQRTALRALYTTTRTFDAAGRELTIVDPLGGTTRKAYDALGNLIKLTDPRNAIGYYYYDALGQVRYQIDPMGFITEKRYDALGNITDELSYARAATGTYTETSTLTQVAALITTDARDRALSKTYEQRGLVRVITYFGATNYTEDYQYNAFGQKRQFKDKNNAVTDYQYDGRGKLTREILPQVEVVTAVLPNVTTQMLRLENYFEYNAFGETTLERQANGTAQQRDTRHYYDDRGREIRTEMPGFLVFNRSTGNSVMQTPAVDTTYDAAGNVVLEVAADGGRTVSYYDTRNLRVAAVDADNTLQEFDYDAVGNLLAERTFDTRLSTSPAPATRPTPVNPTAYRELQHQYNADNFRVATQTRAETLFSYALLLTQPQTSGYYSGPVVTRADYDANGNVVKTVDGNGNPTYQYYDSNGNRVLQVDPAGYVIRWEYNAQGQVERETKYAGQLSTTFRSTLSATTTTASIHAAIPTGDDRITEYVYDRLGRITTERKKGVSYASVNATNGALTERNADIQTSYEYDGNGNVTAEIRPGADGLPDSVNGRVDHTYDALGRKTRQRDPQFQAFNGRGQPLVSTREERTWLYDAHGNAVVQTSLGQVTADNRELRLQYDTAGNIRTQRDAEGAQITFDYDISGNILRSSRSVTDVDNVAHVYRTYYTYDLLSRETIRQDIEDEGTASQATRETQETRYNAHGDIDGRGVNGQFQERYVYDRLGRLFWTNKENGTPRLYVYDANGNAVIEAHGINSDLSGVAGPGAVPALGLSAQLTISVYDVRNQLIEAFDPPMEIGDLGNTPSVTSSGTPGSPAEQLAALGQQPNVYIGGQTLSVGSATTVFLSGPTAVPTIGYGTKPAPSSSQQFLAIPTSEIAWSEPAGTTTTTDPPIDVTSPDGQTRTVTEHMLRRTVAIEFIQEANQVVLRRVTTTVEDIRRVTTFQRSQNQEYGPNDQSLSTTWTTLKSEELDGSTRTVDVKEDRFSRRQDVTVTSAYSGSSSASFPGQVAFTAAVATVTQHNWGPATGFPKFEVIKIQVPEITSYGTGPVRVEVSGAQFGTRFVDITAPGLATISIDGGSPPAIQSVRILKAGNVIVSAPLASSFAIPASAGAAVVSVRAQDPTATSARLRLQNPDGTWGGFVSGTLASGEWIFRGVYDVGQNFEYEVFNGSTLLNRARGTVQTVNSTNNPEYTVTTTTSVQQTKTPAIVVDGLKTYSYNETGFSPVQNNYIRNLVMTITEGAVHSNIIHRTQSYNAFGEIVVQIDGRGNRTDLTYNDLGKLTVQQQPTTLAYSEQGTSTSLRPTTRYYYDQFGQLIGTQDANSEQLATAQKYFNTRALVNGRVAAEFDAYGKATRFYYDRLGDKRQEFNSINRETTYQYDHNGRLQLVTRYDTSGVQHSYDDYDYDQAGNRIAHTDALGNRETYLFDGQDRVRRHASFAGRQTRYDYAYQATIGGIGGYEKTTTTVGTTGNDTQLDRTDYFGRIRWHRDLGGHEFNYFYNQAGWLSSQTSIQTGQNIAYEYYLNGFLKSVADSGISSYARFQYDVNGNRTVEAYSQIPIVGGSPDFYPYQLAKATYDELNRLTNVMEASKFNITYRYDAVGNRRSVFSTYEDLLKQTTLQQNFYYKYDRMNRFTITMGQLTGGAIVRGNTGYEIAYDDLGRRSTASSDLLDTQGNAQAVRETYTYDAIDRVREVFIRNAAGTLVGRTLRENNALGNVDNYREFNASDVQTKHIAYQYDLDSLTTREEDRSDPNKREITTHAYVGAGILTQTTSQVLDASNVQVPNTAVVTLAYNYEKWDDYKENTVTISATAGNVRGWQPGTSTYDYDANGHIVSLYDSQARRSIDYVNNHHGQVLKRHEIDNWPGDGTDPEVIRQFYYMNGIGIGDQGNDNVPSRVDYAQALAVQEKDKAKVHPEIGERVLPVTSADFDQNYQPINPTYPSRAVQSHVVQSGETLQSIARALWGDGSLWYLLADANGLNGNEPLVVNVRLTVPNVVTNIHNNSETFRPYDPALALGDTTPTLPNPPPPPAPKKKGCGILGMILVIAVAVVVTVFTAGAAAPGAASATGGLWSTGAAVLAGGGGFTTAATIGAAAVGGAVGAAASQGVAIALGMQDGFDWKGVALGAIGAGVGAGLGTLATGSNAIGAIKTFAQNNPYTFAALNGAASSALTQGIAVATGLQSSFSWRNVAISSIAAPVARGFGMAAQSILPAAGAFGARFASNIGGALVRRAFGSEEDSASIFANAFGDALGNSIVDSLQPTPAREWVPPEPVIESPLDIELLANLPMPTIDLEEDFFGGATLFADDSRSYVLEYAERNLGLEPGSLRLDQPQDLLDAELVRVFKIEGAGAIHERIAAAAAKRAGIPFDEGLNQGVAWPDVPNPNLEKVDTNYFGTGLNEHKPGTLAFRSHHGDLQFWHSMSPGEGWTNQMIVDQIVGQAMVWYGEALANQSTFPMGKLLHMIQDSYSASHVVRNAEGAIQYFQDYNKQDPDLHGLADKVNSTRGHPQTWRDVPGVLPAIDASADLLVMYRDRAPVAAVADYLRQKVYLMAPGVARNVAGGTDSRFAPPKPPGH